MKPNGRHLKVLRRVKQMEDRPGWRAWVNLDDAEECADRWWRTVRPVAGSEIYALTDEGRQILIDHPEE